MPKTKPHPHPCQDNLQVGYMEWHAKAEKLTRQGVKQLLCPICMRFKFPNEECEERKKQHEND